MMRRTHQQGYLMVVAVALIVMVGFLGMSVAYLFNSRSRASIDHLLSAQALYIAESGLESVTYKLVNPSLSIRTTCGLAGATNVAVGRGVYTVAAEANYAVDANITGGTLSATATTIPVDSTSGYLDYGRLLIDREVVDYTGTTSTSFTGVSRGRDGTTATTHANNTPIGQYQCTATSQGGVPNLTTPSNPGTPGGERTLTRVTELQDGWVVANNSTSTTRVFLRWNKPTEKIWNNTLISGTGVQPLNSISLLSNADGWAVGNAEAGSLNLLRWNGTSWTKVAAAGVFNNNLNGVYCVSTNDCWAVGTANNSNPLIMRWDGSSWGRIFPTANANAALNSVYCVSTSDCWAVGAALGSTPLIERWNGTNWSQVLPTSTSSTAALNSVYCNNTNDCWAVGTTNSNAPLIERWNGTNWSRVFPTVNINVALNSVYCNSTTDCWAVGAANSSNPLIERWNGTNWSRVTPTGTANGALNGVSCFNSEDCWAVGNVVGATSLIMRWDGTSWTRYSDANLTAVALNDIALIGALSRPNSVWKELFP